ncbi:hypothetical protein [Brucella tritici]|uniref:hypothetical protein n=1 Tax=Brucella tritici TaxID=94626 RepID=UPI003D6D24C0
MTVLFKNSQWKVKKCGMSASRYGYFIDRDRIEDRRMSQPDLFSWPLQMASKVWVDLDAFCEAFAHALSIYNPDFDRDRLHRSIEAARLQKAESIRFSQMADKMFPNRSQMTARDLEAVAHAVRCHSGNAFPQ